MGQLVQVQTRKYKLEPENYNLKPKSCPKKPESWAGSEKFSNVANLFWSYFCALKAKSTSQAQIKPEILVNFRPEPDPKSPARLTTH